MSYGHLKGLGNRACMGKKKCEMNSDEIMLVMMIVIIIITTITAPMVGKPNLVRWHEGSTDELHLLLLKLLGIIFS